MTTISMRMPEDVIEELKEIAPKLGFSGYQPLIRAYIGRGLRRDAAELAGAEGADSPEAVEPVEDEPAVSSPVFLYVSPGPETERPRKTPEERRKQVAEKLHRARLVGVR